MELRQTKFASIPRLRDLNLDLDSWCLESTRRLDFDFARFRFKFRVFAQSLEHAPPSHPSTPRVVVDATHHVGPTWSRWRPPRALHRGCTWPPTTSMPHHLVWVHHLPSRHNMNARTSLMKFEATFEAKGDASISL